MGPSAIRHPLVTGFRSSFLLAPSGGMLVGRGGTVVPSKTLDLKVVAQRLQDFARERDWEQFHSPKNLAMALSVEAAELLEIFQWLDEEQSRQLSPEALEAVREEAADVLLYLIRISDLLDIDLVDAVSKKLSVNAQKYPVDKARGISKKYNKL